MPSLSFFIDERDAGLLLARLNTDPEVAFIVPDGRPEKRKAKPRRGQAFVVQEDEPKTEAQTPRHWKAVRTVDALADGFHSLWHVPAGPLPLVEAGQCPGPAPLRPLLGPSNDPLYPPIPDPWSGWIGANRFGSGCLPWIRLELWTRHQSYTEEERATLDKLVSFWTDANEQLVVSNLQWTGGHFRPAPPVTERWWNRMKSWIDRNTVRLRTNPAFWAFPSALERLKNGMRYYSRNFDLEAAIRRAENPGQRE